MKSIKIKHFLLILICFGTSFQTIAQTIPVGTAGLEDYYRRTQILGKVDSKASLMIRPLFPKEVFGKSDVFYPDDYEIRYNLLNAERDIHSQDGKFQIKFLPFGLQTQINSYHGYGMNDGAMISAKGIQMRFNAGIYASYGPLSIQLAPEFIYAENSEFDEFTKDHYDIITAKYYDAYNKIDLPVRFGANAYSTAKLGQSSIRLNHRGLSFGLSTENLWWGPGVKNALLMSNSAPGFAHLTLNTTKPIATSVGSFEGQLIAGRLEGSGFAPLTEDRVYFNNNLFVPKADDWRYLSGLVLVYQPKWISGLFVGLAKSGQMYSKDLSAFSDYLPFARRTDASIIHTPVEKKDTRSSYFARWVWPEEQAEVYFEFGKSNFRGNARESALRKDVSRAYTFGLKKIFPWGKSENEFLLFGIEATQLQQTQPDFLNNNISWYLNDYVRHGYTHMGQLLGAGIGPGANMQSLDIGWVKGLKKLSLQVERRVHNNDLYFYMYRETLDFRRHWTDLSVGLLGNWNLKNFMLNAQVTGIKSLNYQWYIQDEPSQPYMTNGRDVFNLHVQLGAQYRF